MHLIISIGDALDWDRLLKRVGSHWPLLLAQLQVFPLGIGHWALGIDTITIHS